MDRSIPSLTAAIASGDTEAFSVFYRDWFDRAYGLARTSSGRDEQTCLDIVQDAMLRVIKSMQPMATEADLERWLARVIRTCALDRLRCDSRRCRRERSTDDMRSVATDRADGDLEDRIRWLRDELEKLNPSDSLLLAMRHRFNWTLRQIGEVLRQSPGAVDGRINRLVLLLRRKATEKQP